MTFEETCESIRQQQADMQRKLSKISQGIEMLKHDNDILYIKNRQLKAEKKELMKQIAELKADKERLQDLIVILTKPDETQK